MMFHGLLIAAALLGATPQATSTLPPSSITVEVTGHGRPMILIPGFVSSGAVWKTVVDHYKDRYECHVVNIAGFAGIPAVDGTTLARLRDDVIAYVKAKKLDRPIIVGHSMGGVLALWIAETDPALPGAIISVDGVPFLRGLMNPAATADTTGPQAAQMKTVYASMTPQQLGAQSRLAFTNMISDKAQVDEATKWAETSDPKTAAALIGDLLTTDLRANVGNITAPLLLIPAVKAMSASPEMLKTAVAAYEGQVSAVRTHEVVPAPTLHFVMLDDPSFLLKTMDAFLAKH
jgi:pimeloyl-ACP methyl ester carboxylesterase